MESVALPAGGDFGVTFGSGITTGFLGWDSRMAFEVGPEIGVGFLNQLIFMKSGILTSGAVVTLLCAALVSSTPAAPVPRAEHPRPDVFRTNWLTLNGEWQ